MHNPTRMWQKSRKRGKPLSTFNILNVINAIEITGTNGIIHHPLTEQTTMERRSVLIDVQTNNEL